MADIPVRKDEIKTILAKRKMMAKVCCCLCERRIGWFCPDALARFFHLRKGNCVCEVCWDELIMKHGVGTDAGKTADKAGA